MITGFHTIIYSEDAEATRAFFRDVLEWPSVDAGGGWLIFKTPPAEMGVHPAVSEGGERWATIPHAQLSVMCDDLVATIADLQGKGVEVAEEIRNEGFGLVTEIEVPGAGSMMLYQPLHPVAHEIDG
jgi:catechol 2,3-dioxygenase-like lactoylglutathione lyase family enzyme